MKTLFLLRHAKSSWDDPELPDHDRPLNGRGRRTAPFMGKLMKEKGLVPDIILSSTAKRARQTAELLTQAAEFQTDINFDQRIYEASPGSLHQVLCELGDDESVLLIGHNPSIEGFICHLTNSVEPMPTAALAVIDLSLDKWEQIKNDCGKVRCVYRPKDEMR